MSPFQGPIGTGIAINWTYPTGGGVQGGAAIGGDGTVYVGSNDNSVYALNGQFGYPVWSYQTSGPVSATPAISGSTVFAGSKDGKVYAVRVWSRVPVLFLFF